MAKHGIRAWKSWIEGNNEMTFERNKTARRIAPASLQYTAPEKLFRDAAPTGSVVGRVGEGSEGYSEYNKTNRSFPQGKIGGTDPQRGDGAIRHVLAQWKTGA